MNILDLALYQSDDNMANETCTNTYSDAVSEWHEDDGQESRNSDSII